MSAAQAALVSMISREDK